MTNSIHETAVISKNVKLGKFNSIGKNVVIEADCSKSSKILIGDNNIINDNVKIIVNGDFSVGDWNVFHNNMLIMSGEGIDIGCNCWFGQHTILDGAGGLSIGNGVRVGMYSQLWTHVASGELIEGCTLFSRKKTRLDDDAWLVGSCVVSPGLSIGRKAIALINSVITKNIEAGKVYSGCPAKEMDGMSFYKEDVSLEQKFQMMKVWCGEFVSNNKQYSLFLHQDELKITENDGSSSLCIFKKYFPPPKGTSCFFLDEKSYTKTNQPLERKFMRFIYGNKARFLPL